MQSETEHLLSPRRIAESDLVALSFELRESGLGADAASNLVGWLIDEFALGRCASLASVIAHRVGREQFVAFERADGRLAHAVVACSPQDGTRLVGWAVDILGRRRLAEVAHEVESISGPVTPRIGDPIGQAEMEDAEAASLFALAAELPWLRAAMRMPLEAPDHGRLVEAARTLGFPG